MRLAEQVTFGGSGLERAAHLRGDAAALAELWATAGTGVLPVWRGKPLFEGEHRSVLGWLPPSDPLVKARLSNAVFLGLDDGRARFAVDLSDWEPEVVPDTLNSFVDPSEQHHPDLPETLVFAELRRLMTVINSRDAELAATAKALIGWQRSHRFCALCGAESVMTQAGWQRDCPVCDGKHFPRTDPVVIMLITHGNSVLLGRSPGWPEGMYSLLAGFVEPGETIEAAVRREVFEEAGITVGEVSYLASQPWPFPSSLMIGCRGTATSRDITIDPVEIEDAIWVSREELLSIFAGEHHHILPARKGAIAQFLMSNWLADRLN